MTDNCEHLIEEYKKCIRNIHTTSDNTYTNTCFLIWDNLIKCHLSKDKNNKESTSAIKFKEFKYCTLSNYYSFSSSRE